MIATRTAVPVTWDWAGRVPDLAADTPLVRLVHRGFADLPAGASMLDVGCGDGAWLRRLASWGFDAVGVDPCPSAQGLRRDGRKLFEFHQRFHGYLSLGVWEHDQEGPQAFARAAWQVLRPGGRLVVSVPLLNWIALCRGQTRGVFYQWVFGRREFVGLLQDAGFAIDWTATYGEGYTAKRLVGARMRRRLRWLRWMPGLSRATGHMLLVVATKRDTHAPA